MSEDLFQLTLRYVLEVDGGDADGAPTRAPGFGLRQSIYDEWRRKIGREKADLADLKREEAIEIYRIHYWDPIKMLELPQPISVLMMEMSVNAGRRRAAKTLHKALNRLGGELKENGEMGPATTQAVLDAVLEDVVAEFMVQRGRFDASPRRFAPFGARAPRKVMRAVQLAHQLMPSGLPTQGDDADQAITPPTQIRRYFHNDLDQQVYATFSALWGGWATSAQRFDAMDLSRPPFVAGSLAEASPVAAAALIGVAFPDAPPRPPKPGEAAIALGYPAGATRLSARRVEIVGPRIGAAVWTARITAPDEPIVDGMEGGVVFSPETQEILGVIAYGNPVGDVDGDGLADLSFDFAALSDIYQDHIGAAGASASRSVA